MRAARHDIIANFKRFFGLGHQRPNSDNYVYIQYAAPLYSAFQRPFPIVCVTFHSEDIRH